MKIKNSDIRDIAVADCRFNSYENIYNRIAKELGINVMTIDKNTIKKLVTKYEKRIHS